MFGEYAMLVQRLAGLVTAFIVLYLLTESRFDRNRTIAAFAGGGVLIGVFLSLLYVFGGDEMLIRWYPLVANVPGLVLMLVVSRQRPLVVVFTNLVAVQLNGIIVLPAIFVEGLVSGVDPTLVNLFVRLVIFVPLVVVLCRWFRPLYLEVARTLRRGWGLLCLIPLAFYAQLYLVFVLGAVPDPLLRFAVVACAFATVIAACGIVFVYFGEHVRRMEAAEGERMLATQVGALEREVDAVRSADERLRIIRHDLRYHVENVAALVRAGHADEALAALGKAEGELAETSPRRFCENETVNALLSLYVARAEGAGVEVEIRCDIPRDLPMAALELASVLANAFENAVAACERQPEGTPRRIVVRCACAPRFALEVANTYSGPVVFDSLGRPITKEPGHGVGTRSIAAFAKKHGARLFYDAGDDGVFRLQMLMPSQEKMAS